MYKATNSERTNREMLFTSIRHILLVQLRKAQLSADEYNLENIFLSNIFVLLNSSLQLDATS